MHDYNEFMMAANEKQAVFFLLTSHSYTSVPCIYVMAYV